MTTEVLTVTSLKHDVKIILERHQGRIRPIPRKELGRLLGLSEKQDRKLRLTIAELRHDGFPILFANEAPSGYYLPFDLDELHTGIRLMRSYVIDECRTMRDLRIYGTQYLMGHKGQLHLL